MSEIPVSLRVNVYVLLLFFALNALFRKLHLRIWRYQELNVGLS